MRPVYYYITDCDRPTILYNNITSTIFYNINIILLYHRIKPRADGCRKTKTGLWPDQAQVNTAASPIESELVFMVLGNGCEYI